MSILYTTTSSKTELNEILALQKKNLPIKVSEAEMKQEGFVTVEHDFNMLKSMNDKQPHIIAKSDDAVVGYALCMTRDFKSKIEILKPMFDKIDTLVPSDTSYIVMGQVCVDKGYRKQGIFRGLYDKMRDELQSSYSLLITEVAANNKRSLQAHYAIGFKDLLVYEADQIVWHIVQWDWKS